MATSPYAAGRTPTTDEMNQICEAILGNTSGTTPNRKLKLDATDLSTDTISERTAAAGVTVDGLLIKDGALKGTLTPYEYNGGGTGGPTAQAITSGSYTPTVTGILNIDSLFAYTFYYIRIGNVCIASGSVAVDPTATGATSFSITLPIASDILTSINLSGHIASQLNYGEGSIYGSAASDYAIASLSLSSTSSSICSCSFLYLIR